MCVVDAIGKEANTETSGLSSGIVIVVVSHVVAAEVVISADSPDD
jgi:hypothetical protein